MQVNCRDHRKSLELIGLRERLKDIQTKDEEREEIIERVKILERELGMD